MKRLKAIISMAAIATLLLSLSATAQSVVKEAEQPAVVSAVAPAYPAVAKAARARGEVVVEVKIDAKGKVVSAAATTGHELLRKSSEAAAMRWQFSAAQDSKERTARLTFSYATTYDAKTTDAEFVISFLPPYRIEVKYNPPIVH